MQSVRTGTSQACASRRAFRPADQQLTILSLDSRLKVGLGPTWQT